MIPAMLAPTTMTVDTSGTLALHPANPPYLQLRGKPVVLITSGEHYGAVLNLDFDYVAYLDALKQDGLNLTRTFSGAYVEPLGAFKIARNTLAPAPGRFICPWARSATPGYANGGNKFDLSKWDPAYFSRLRDFVGQAGQRGIVVEVVLFCVMYGDSEWSLSPLNSANNVNDVGNIPRDQILNLSNAAVTAVEDALTVKLISELNGYDNVYFELCNEPYAVANVTQA